MLSLVFMAIGIPLLLCASWAIGHGLRFSLVIAGLVNMLGCWIRYLAEAGETPHQKYSAMFVGQVLCAIAQPVILDSPTVLAAYWFGESERAEANTVASVSNPIGIAVGSVLAPSMVAASSDMGSMLMTMAWISTVAAGFTIIFLKDRPPTPPSSSAETEPESFWVHSLTYPPPLPALDTRELACIHCTTVESHLLIALFSGWRP